MLLTCLSKLRIDNREKLFTSYLEQNLELFENSWAKKTCSQITGFWNSSVYMGWIWLKFN